MALALRLLVLKGHRLGQLIYQLFLETSAHPLGINRPFVQVLDQPPQDGRVGDAGAPPLVDSRFDFPVVLNGQEKVDSDVGPGFDSLPLLRLLQVGVDPKLQPILLAKVPACLLQLDASAALVGAVSRTWFDLDLEIIKAIAGLDTPELLDL